MLCKSRSINRVTSGRFRGMISPGLASAIRKTNFRKRCTSPSSRRRFVTPRYRYPRYTIILDIRAAFSRGIFGLLLIYIKARRGELLLSYLTHFMNALGFVRITEIPSGAIYLLLCYLPRLGRPLNSSISLFVAASSRLVQSDGYDTLVMDVRFYNLS